MPSDAADPTATDLLLVGGGLANGLIALRLVQIRPDIRIRVLEGADRLGGVHTWSFFDSDLTPEQRAWTAPLVAHRWPGYHARFPGHERRLSTPYCSVTSERFDAVMREALGDRLSLGVAVDEVRPDGVRLADGRWVAAGGVVDGRGPAPFPDLALGYQKFVGIEIEVDAPHGVELPIIMDATVDQVGGYRFLYVLPLSPTRLLVEDTRYDDGASLDRQALRDGALDYAGARGWTIKAIVREEDGVLPVALDGDIAAHHRRLGPTGQSGLRAGLFHPTTGYSLPDAVRLADGLAAAPPDDWRTVGETLRTVAMERWGERGFYRLLNRMLFRAAEPGQRYRILERFYRLPEPLVERFYAARSTLADKARILSGKPPVPLGRAIGCLLERGHA